MPITPIENNLTITETLIIEEETSEGSSLLWAIGGVVLVGIVSVAMFAYKLVVLKNSVSSVDGTSTQASLQPLTQVHNPLTAQDFTPVQPPQNNPPLPGCMQCNLFLPPHRSEFSLSEQYSSRSNNGGGAVEGTAEEDLQHLMILRQVAVDAGDPTERFDTIIHATIGDAQAQEVVGELFRHPTMPQLPQDTSEQYET